MTQPAWEVIEHMFRASGEQVCDYCGSLYCQHPLDYQNVSWQGEPFLHILCNGDRVKL